MKLAAQLVASTIAGLLFLGVALLLPAGTVNYWQAWVFIAVFIVCVMGPTGYLALRDPAALQRRMHGGPAAETRPVQRITITATVLLAAVLLVVCALDHRFGWSSVPLGMVVFGNVLVAAALLESQWVVFQNRYAAATITVEAGQKLVSTGLYGLVRHPMYAGALVMLIGTPPALGSWWGLVTWLPAPLILRARILDEEQLLQQELPGYRDYLQQVRYRLVPGVW